MSKNNFTISQCMITKNEEYNIRKALAWGAGIVCEQIVVDTGSEDKTVEIAKEFGAKVYHFDWCDDFSAAKNYAIEQASGDWIAFLDADEYFTSNSAKRLPSIIESIEKSHLPLSAKPNIIAGRMKHLDDDGKTFMENIQDRIFRNQNGIRYQNKIHECLSMNEEPGLIRLDSSLELTIIHTGYSKSAYMKTGKLERNVHLLKKELTEFPNDKKLLSYLADCYISMDKLKEAKEIYKKIQSMPIGKPTDTETIFHAAVKAMEITANSEIQPESSEEMSIFYKKANELNSKHPDPDYFMGIWAYKAKKPSDILIYLEKALFKTIDYSGITPVSMTGKNLMLAYRILIEASAILCDNNRAVKYAMFSLTSDKYQADILVTLIHLFSESSGNESGTNELALIFPKLYDYHNLKDKLFLLKCAKLSGNVALETYVDSIFSDKELLWLEQ